MKLSSLIRSLALALTVATLHAAVAGPTMDVKSGSAAIVLDPAFVAGAVLLQAKISKIAPASYTPLKRTVTVSVVGGAYQLSDAQGEIHGSGGFKLTKDTLSISLVDFALTLPSDPTQAAVSALLTANGTFLGRVTLSTFDAGDLNITTPVVVPNNKKLSIKSIPLKLTTSSATFLNNALGVSVFHNGDAIGTVNINFKVAGKL